MAGQREPRQPRGLATGFEAWWAPAVDSAAFIREGLIVLDANVLLHVYRVTPGAREQILSTLYEVRERIWIPHQAALEFHRNRSDVVLSRLKYFKEIRQVLQQAPAKAVAELRKAVLRFRTLQQAAMTSRDWKPEENGLDEASIRSLLDGILDGALFELAQIELEHDFGPKELQVEDPILLRLEEITAGRVGEPYNSETLRLLTDEAVNYRFPNEIPPGYKDAETKATDYRSAGDYILWRQIIDYVTRLHNSTLLLVVTNDAKEDWWLLDTKGKPISGRPELKQEVFDNSGAQMSQMLLSDFLAAVSGQFPDQISPETVSEVRESEIATQVEGELSTSLDGRLDLLSLSPILLEHLVRQLLESMGYAAFLTVRSEDTGFDIEASRFADAGKTIIEVKRYRGIVPTQALRALRGAMVHVEAQYGMIFTTSRFSQSSKTYAAENNITLIDGKTLVHLLRENLGIEATVPDGLDS